MALSDDRKDLIKEGKNPEIEKEIFKIRNGEIKISDISANAPHAQAIVDGAIASKPMFFADTRKDQRTENNALIFVKHVLTTSKNQNVKEVSYYETLDLHPALKLHYESVADESVEYFDKDLELPTQLKTKLTVSLVIHNALQLIDTLNFNLNFFSIVRLYSVIRTEITATVKSKILEYIQAEKLGYFDFEFSCIALSETIRTALEEKMAKYGIGISKFSLEKLSIPDQVSKFVQDEYMNARALSIRSVAEKIWANSSLEILERKSEIIEKYKLPGDTLSEMEKDKAMERYIKKVEHKLEPRIEYQKESVIRNTSEDILIATLPEEPVEPAELVDTNKSKVVAFSICTLASLLLLIAGVIVNVNVVLCLGILSLIVSAALLSVVVIKRIINRKVYKDYKSKVAIYNEALKAYKKEEQDYKAASKKLANHPDKYYEKDGAIYEKRTPII